MDEPIDHWHPGAAYLYVLHLDGPGLAWEYLRRHPDYRRDWQRRHRCHELARRWGLRLLEDPALDARDAQPLWTPEPDAVIQLYPDAVPPPKAHRFGLWRIPGRKQLLHDGCRVVLLTRFVNGSVRLALAPGLEAGMPYVHAVRSTANAGQHGRALAAELATLDNLAKGVLPEALASPRPSPTVLLELHTLQALDGILAGASLRTVASVLFEATTVAREWHADGPLRARVRRLVRRGRSLMQGGYRKLVPLPVEEGRSVSTTQRP